MKNFLILLSFLALQQVTYSQVINITYSGNTLIDATHCKFDVYGQAGTGYVTMSGSTTNASGSWSAIQIRFDINIPNTNTLTGITMTRNTAVTTGANANVNPPPTATSSTYNDGSMSFLNSTNSAGDFTATRVLLGTATLTFSSAITGTETLTTRLSDNSVTTPDPTSWWTTNATSAYNNFAFTNPNFTLPVDFNSFSGTGKGCTANLAWVTGTEINSSYFGVEYSKDGISFTQKAKITSRNSSTGSSYTYLYDGLGSGANYFRLKAVDFDGKYTYSNIITVTGTGACSAGIIIKVSPNPTRDLVSIQGLVTGSLISLLDLSGKKLIDVVATSTTQTISLSGYVKGIYLIRVQAADGGISNIKVVKQ